MTPSIFVFISIIIIVSVFAGDGSTITIEDQLQFTNDNSKWITGSFSGVTGDSRVVMLSENYFYEIGCQTIPSYNLQLLSSSAIPNKYKSSAALFAGADLISQAPILLMAPYSNQLKLLEVEVSGNTWTTKRTLSIPNVANTVVWQYIIPDYTASLGLPNQVFLLSYDYVVSVKYNGLQFSVEDVIKLTSNQFSTSTITGASLAPIYSSQTTFYEAQSSGTSSPGIIIQISYDSNGQLTRGNSVFTDQSPNNFISNGGGTGSSAAQLVWTQTKNATNGGPAGIVYVWDDTNKDLNEIDVTFQNNEVWIRAVSVTTTGDCSLYASGFVNQTGYTLRNFDMQNLQSFTTLSVTNEYMPDMSVEIGGALNYNGDAVILGRNNNGNNVKLVHYYDAL